MRIMYFCGITALAAGACSNQSSPFTGTAQGNKLALEEDYDAEISGTAEDPATFEFVVEFGPGADDNKGSSVVRVSKRQFDWSVALDLVNDWNRGNRGITVSRLGSRGHRLKWSRNGESPCNLKVRCLSFPGNKDHFAELELKPGQSLHITQGLYVSRPASAATCTQPHQGAPGSMSIPQSK